MFCILADFQKKKGIKTLLKACEKLNDIPFVFAGKGPLENEVNQLKNVKNIGFTKGKKLFTRQLQRRSLLSSRQSGMKTVHLV